MDFFGTNLVVNIEGTCTSKSIILMNLISSKKIHNTHIHNYTVSSAENGVDYGAL